MIRSLKMLVLPLVAGCMVASICALGDAGSGMGRTAAWTLGTFFATTCIAAMLGVTMAAAFHPGHDGDLSSQGMPTGTHTGKILVLLGASCGASFKSCNSASIHLCISCDICQLICILIHSIVLSCAGMQHQQKTQVLSTLWSASKLMSHQHALHTTSGDVHNRQVLICMSEHDLYHLTAKIYNVLQIKVCFSFQP